MAKVVLIESRDPHEHARAAETTALARGLLQQRDEVTVFLIENGVLAARRSARSAPLVELAGEGATILADDLSLRTRGIDRAQLADGVRAASVDALVDRLAEGQKTLWF